MPELPEVERAASRLRRAAVGKAIVSVKLFHPSLRKRVSAARLRSLRGARIERVLRRGKHQLLELDDGRVIHVHFRMAGDWEFGSDAAPLERYARAAISLSDETRVSLVDPRALSTIVVHAVGDASVPDLGPEPSDSSLTAASLASSLTRRRGPIKPVLLDQRVLAGVGNIYASEALWRARIDPLAMASGLDRERLEGLLDAIREVLGPAGRPAPRRQSRGSRRIAVYGREGKPCYRCRALIVRITQAGRSSYFCPVCQAR